MAFVTYTLGEKHSRSGLAGGFAHILGKPDGLSKEYVFGRGDDSIAPADVVYTHEVDGEDAELFRDMLEDGRLDKAEFTITDEAPQTAAQKRRAARAAQDAAAHAAPGE